MQDIAAERAILSGIVQYGNNGLLEVNDMITSDAFSDKDNQILYTILQNVLVTHESIDLASIISCANGMQLSNYIEKEENIRYIRSLLNFPIKFENIRLYAKKLKKLHIAKTAQLKHKLAFDELSKITGNEAIDEILSISEKPIQELYNELTDKQDGPQLIWDNGLEFLTDLADNPVENIGIPTPWPRYNAAIGSGLRRGGVALIGARPKNGKSSMSKDCAVHVAKNLKIPVLYLDTEMVKNEQLMRVVAGISKVDTSRIETGKFGKTEIEREKVLNAIRQNAKVPFYHISVAGKEFDEILSIIRRWVLRVVGYDDNGKVNNCLVIYDYFKLMSSDTLKQMEEYQALGFQVSKLSDFCKILDFPILAFVQLNRDGVTKETSDIISQSDRLLWLCTSFTILKRKTEEEISVDGIENGNTKLIPLEARFGPCLEMGDYINMNFQKTISVMTELSTRNELKNKKQDSGFTIDDNNTEDN